ncbi:hypothetical protein [Nocardioides jiangxiensis]|uniref:Lipoprotein n=1 Tax=Nocardioides jiangxiensis TaxID=3064524 RepID=A0ABT9B0S4_9ACTN|nr:hypothetical protein [Nocardioides sp. WY-20]MDO7867227.1 hypothetical protein [Nocardioides sp. WY-20]
MKDRLVAALVITTLSAGALAGCGEDTTPAPATKKALAAVAVDDLGITPSSYGLTPSWYYPAPLQVEVRWHPKGSHDAHRLTLDATADAPARGCPAGEDAPRCATWRVKGGTAVLTWETEAPEEDPGLFHLAWQRGGELREAGYAGAAITGDPRAQAGLPVSVDDLLGVLTDSRFGVTSTRAMVHADLAKWPKDEAAGDVVRQTPQGMAARLNEQLGAPMSGQAADASRYGAGAIGVTLHYRDRDLTVVQVSVGAVKQPRCAAGWSCQPRKGEPAVVTGWRPGVATAVWTDVAGGVTVVVTEHDPRITRDPRPRWGNPGRPGSDVAMLAGWRSWWSAYELRQTAEQRPAWFR